MKHSSRQVPQMELLPSRVMLSATLENGHLLVRGTERNDQITLSGTWSGEEMIELFVHQSGRDTVKFNPADVKSIHVLGSGGNDTIIDETQGDFEVTLSGGEGNDQIKSFGGRPVIRGGRGDDLLTTRWVRSSVEDGAGRDSIVASNGRDIIAGKSWMHLHSNGTAEIHGSKGDDVINFGIVLAVECQADMVDCGDDRNPPPGIPVFFNGVKWTLPEESVKKIVAYLGDGDDAISLNSDHNEIGWLIGPEISARIFAGRGNDTVIGSSLADYIRGGEGDDSIHAGGGNDSVHGGDGNDFVDGDDDADRIRGGLGDDTLSGELGDDRLFGGRGNDQLDGGDGTNLLEPGPQESSDLETGLGKFHRAE